MFKVIGWRLYGAIFLLVCALPASASFDGGAATRKSAALTEAEMNQAWNLFESGVRAARAGNWRSALKFLRSGLTIHPAEMPVQLLAAELAEAHGQDAAALDHWQAVASLAPTDSKERTLADQALKRLQPATTAALAATPGSGIDRAGFEALVRVQAYAGAPRPAAQVATVFAADGGRYGKTELCTAGAQRLMPADASGCAAVVYLLPGTYTLGWQYEYQGTRIEGQSLPSRFEAGKFYQVNISLLGQGRVANNLFPMPALRTLTYRNIAPALLDVAGIDEPVPYGRNR